MGAWDERYGTAASHHTGGIREVSVVYKASEGFVQGIALRMPPADGGESIVYGAGPAGEGPGTDQFSHQPKATLDDDESFTVLKYLTAKRSTYKPGVPWFGPIDPVPAGWTRGIGDTGHIRVAPLGIGSIIVARLHIPAVPVEQWPEEHRVLFLRFESSKGRSWEWGTQDTSGWSTPTMHEISLADRKLAGFFLGIDERSQVAGLSVVTLINHIEPPMRVSRILKMPDKFRKWAGAKAKPLLDQIDLHMATISTSGEGHQATDDAAQSINAAVDNLLSAAHVSEAREGLLRIIGPLRQLSDAVFRLETKLEHAHQSLLVHLQLKEADMKRTTDIIERCNKQLPTDSTELDRLREEHAKLARNLDEHRRRAYSMRRDVEEYRSRRSHAGWIILAIVSLGISEAVTEGQLRDAEHRFNIAQRVHDEQAQRLAEHERLVRDQEHRIATLKQRLSLLEEDDKRQVQFREALKAPQDMMIGLYPALPDALKRTEDLVASTELIEQGLSVRSLDETVRSVSDMVATMRRLIGKNSS